MSAPVLIQVGELARLLAVAAQDPADRLAALRRLTVLDVRWRLGGPPGRELYDAAHTPARRSSTLTWTWPRRRARAAGTPMPAAAEFEQAMRRAGVSDGRPVVVYDDADSTAAARAWWLLRYFGHPSVLVLDGGFRAWTAAGIRSIRRARPTTGRSATSPRARATWTCSARTARRPSRGPACSSTPGRESGTGARPSTSTRWRVTSLARSAPRRQRTSTRMAPSGHRPTWPPASRPSARTATARWPPTAARASPRRTRSSPSRWPASPPPSTLARGRTGSPIPPACRHRTVTAACGLAGRRWSRPPR